MTSLNEQILKVTKEVIVKFIEAGRLSPSSFHETFTDVYNTVEATVKNKIDESQNENQ